MHDSGQMISMLHELQFMMLLLNYAIYAIAVYTRDILLCTAKASVVCSYGDLVAAPL